MLVRARAFREKFFQPESKLALKYGILRGADFLANRPARGRVAGFAGRGLERLFGFHAQGFYDAGRFDSLMPEFAARRASRLLKTLDGVADHRRRIIEEIRRSLGSTSALFQPDDGAQGSCAFLLVNAAGEAHAWRERAASEGVTLRLVWPAYQNCEAAQLTPDVRWLAEHLAVLEIHPDLTVREVRRIERCLRNLA
jgi:dTDP-4-amino-4,6-dideoxygalactose transaminase